MEGPDLRFTEAVIDNGTYGKHVVRFESGLLARQIEEGAPADIFFTADEARKAMDRCPVGAILKKEVGFAVPIGRRKYDKAPIGSDVETPGT